MPVNVNYFLCAQVFIGRSAPSFVPEAPHESPDDALHSLCGTVLQSMHVSLKSDWIVSLCTQSSSSIAAITLLSDDTIWSVNS